MNTIVEHINSAGFSFVEFALPMLIQSGVLIVILLLVDLLLRKKVKAVFRYWIWMLVLVKLVLPTSLSSPLSLGYLFGDKLTYQDLAQSSATLEPAEPAPADISPGMDPLFIQPNPYIPPTEPVISFVEPMVAEPVSPPEVPVTPLSWQGIVFLVWLAVLIAMGLLLLQRALFVRGLVAQAKKASRLMNDELAYCCASMGIKSKVSLKISVNATTPSVCGLIKPVILVPWNLTSTLGVSRMRTILMHELAHIKRADLWVNLAQTALQIIYFYNPLLWLANCVIRRIREQAVDEAVLVAMGEKAQKYPQTLVDVAKMAFKRPALSLRLIGVVESKSALAGRIKHILSRPMPKSARLGLISILAIIIAGAVLLPMARAQRQAEPETSIEAASLEHFVGKYAIAKHPDTAVFEITKKGDVFIFSDLGGPKFEMEEAEDGLKFADGGGERFRVRYDALKNRYILDRLGMRGEVQDATSFELTELIKISSEKPGDIFAARLPNGVTVELMGVCELPGQGKQWWAADGSLLEDIFWEGSTANRESSVDARQVVFRIRSDESDPALDPTISFKPKRRLQPPGSWSGAFFVEKDNQTLEELRGCSFSLHDDQRSIDISADIGYGPWKTLTKLAMNSEISLPKPVFTDIGYLTWNEPTEEGGKTTVSATLFDAVKVWRIVAVDKQGDIHTSNTASGQGFDGHQIVKATFSLPLSRIEKFRFQTRPFGKITFKNVSLEPNFKTDVQAEGPTKEDAVSNPPQPELLSATPPIFAYNVKLNFADPTVRDGTFHSEQSIAFCLSFHNIEIPPAGKFTLSSLLIGQTTWPVHLEDNGITIKEGVAGQKIRSLTWPADEPKFEKVIKIPVKYGQKEYSCPVRVQLDRRDKETPTGSYWFCAYLSGRLPWGAGGRGFEIVNLDQQMEFRLTGDGTDPRDAVLGIDIDGDGKIDPAKTGGEQFDLYEPFQIGPKTYRLTEVDPYLPRVVFRELVSEKSLKPPAKTDVQVEGETTSQSQFSKTLPNGITVELAGILEFSDGKVQSCWKPDGIPFDEPIHVKYGPKYDHKVFGFVFNTDIPSEIIKYDIKGTMDRLGSAAVVDANDRLTQLTRQKKQHIKLLKLAESDTTQISLSIVPEWKSSTQYDGKYITGRKNPKIKFLETYESGDSLKVVFSHEYEGYDFRLQAYLTQDATERLRNTPGRTYLYRRNGKLSIVYTPEGMKRTSALFEGLKLSDIKYFTLYIRSKPEKVEFKNVPLRPSDKTDVQIEVESEKISGVVGVQDSTLGKSTSAEAAFIIQKVLDRYAAIKTYSAIGELLTDVDRPLETMGVMPGMTTEMLQQMGEQQLKSIFTIKMARPNLYCIEWSENIDTDLSKVGNAWSVGDGSYGLIHGKEKSFEKALRALIWTANNMGRVQSSLFFDTSLNTLRELRDLSQQEDEQPEGVDCYVISGSRHRTTYTYWVSKKDFLIRRYKFVSGGDGKPIEGPGHELTDETIKVSLKAMDKEVTPEEIAKTRAMLTAAIAMASGVKVTNTETYRNIILDQSISEEQFVPSKDIDEITEELKNLRAKYIHRLKNISPTDPNFKSDVQVEVEGADKKTDVKRRYPILLTWPLIQNASKYVVKIKGIRGSRPTTNFESTTNSLNLGKADIAPGRYHWTVSAYDKHGNFIGDIKPIEPAEIFAIEDRENGKMALIDLNHSAGHMRGWGFYNHAQYMTKELLENAGFTVEVNERDLLTADKLKSVDLLICHYYWTGWPSFRPYLKSELTAIRQFVEKGGSLLVVGCDRKDGGGKMCEAGNELVKEFGLLFELDKISEQSRLAQIVTGQNVISFSKPVPVQLPVSVQGRDSVSLLQFDGVPIARARQFGKGKVIVAGVGMSFLDCYLGDFEHREPLHLIMFYDFIKYLTAIDWRTNCKQEFVETVLSRCQFQEK